MDLKLVVRVLAAHRTLMLVGLVAAVLLAALSYYRVSTDDGLPTLVPRKAEVWQSQANVFLTEGGFPAGRRTIPFVTKVVGDEVVAVPQYSDPARFGALTALYARLAQSDEVRQLMEKDGGSRGTLRAAPTADDSRSRDPLPMVSLFGQAATSTGAVATVTRGLDAFLAYVTRQQQAAGIPADERITLRVVNRPQPAILIQPRKKTLPIVVFMAVLIGAVAAAFGLENARSNRLVPVHGNATNPSEQPLAARQMASEPYAGAGDSPEADAPVIAAAASEAAGRAQEEPDEPDAVVPVRRWA